MANFVSTNCRKNYTSAHVYLLVSLYDFLYKQTCTLSIRFALDNYTIIRKRLVFFLNVSCFYRFAHNPRIRWGSTLNFSDLSNTTKQNQKTKRIFIDEMTFYNF
jgi:hypothetical protein